MQILRLLLALLVSAIGMHAMPGTAAEVSDFKDGEEMVEEKARAELGMVKSNEILVRLTDKR